LERSAPRQADESGKTAVAPALESRLDYDRDWKLQLETARKMSADRRRHKELAAKGVSTGPSRREEELAGKLRSKSWSYGNDFGL
jgi:hypothetical protein